MKLETILTLTDAQVAELDYERAMAALDIVVNALEEEGTALAHGITLYELGMKLSRRCGDLLNATEARMAKVLESGIQRPIVVNFDIEKEGR
jgi:exodeoxyribonuclease VII small subunit